MEQNKNTCIFNRFRRAFDVNRRVPSVHCSGDERVIDKLLYFSSTGLTDVTESL